MFWATVSSSSWQLAAITNHQSPISNYQLSLVMNYCPYCLGKKFIRAVYTRWQTLIEGIKEKPLGKLPKIRGSVIYRYRNLINIRALYHS